jgi:structure-specific endonuclease subunit SLX1
MEKKYCVYILQSVSNPRRTYVGVTNDRVQRLRRHNGLITGGAKATSSDRPWKMVRYLDGFEYRHALQFEWSMHHPRKRKLKTPYYGLEGRLNCMNQLVATWDKYPLHSE